MSAEAVVPFQIVSVSECIFACTVPNCTQLRLPADEAFVPDVRWLYKQIRNGDVQKAYPLTRSDIRPFVRCHLHSHGSIVGLDYNKRMGIESMFRVVATLRFMEQWAADNARRLEAEQHQREKAEQDRRRAMRFANRGGSGQSFVLKTFADLAKPFEGDKPNPKRRKHTHIDRPKYEGPKKYGDERKPSAEEKPSKKQKNKKGGEQKGRNNKK